MFLSEVWRTGDLLRPACYTLQRTGGIKRFFGVVAVFGGWEPFKNMAGDNFRQQHILRYFIWERYYIYIYIYSYFISSNHLIASHWAWRCKMFIFGFCKHGRRCLDFRPIPEMNSICPPSKQQAWSWQLANSQKLEKEFPLSKNTPHQMVIHYSVNVQVLQVLIGEHIPMSKILKPGRFFQTVKPSKSCSLGLGKGNLFSFSFRAGIFS